MSRTSLDRALADPAIERLLPNAVADLLWELDAPPRLAAHLRAVHDVAWQLVDANVFAALPFDRGEVLFGAATHDIGKVVHTNELSQPGSDHERAGYRLLVEHGFDHRLARFAANHGTWTSREISTEDLVVSLADKVWKAKRVPDLEDRIVERIVDVSGDHPWQVFLTLDDTLDRVAGGAETRLRFQNAYPTVA